MRELCHTSMPCLGIVDTYDSNINTRIVDYETNETLVTSGHCSSGLAF